MAGFTQHLQEGMLASIQDYSSKMQKLGIILLDIIDNIFINTLSAIEVLGRFSRLLLSGFHLRKVVKDSC